jgi:hypothetical protein
LNREMPPYPSPQGLAVSRRSAQGEHPHGRFDEPLVVIEE